MVGIDMVYLDDFVFVDGSTEFNSNAVTVFF